MCRRQGLYDEVKQLFAHRHHGEDEPILAKVAAALCVSAVGITVANPSDVVKVGPAGSCFQAVYGNCRPQPESAAQSVGASGSNMRRLVGSLTAVLKFVMCRCQLATCGAAALLDADWAVQHQHDGEDRAVYMLQLSSEHLAINLTCYAGS